MFVGLLLFLFEKDCSIKSNTTHFICTLNQREREDMLLTVCLNDANKEAFR